MGAFSFAFSSAFDASAFTAALPLTMQLSPSVVKEGDMHSVTATIQDSASSAFDLTGATVRLLARNQATDVASILASGLGAATGTVVHGLDGTLPEGTYLLEVESTLSGAVITAPTDGYARLHVVRDLG